MRNFFQLFNFVNTHPLTKKNKLNAILRILKWQVISRLYPIAFVLPFIEDSKLIVKNGMAGATGNLYAGLHDFEDMAFLLHLLRAEDLFGDIGANIGAYTILASGVVKAKSITVEPIPHTFNHLKHNIQINDLERLVTAYNKGVGALEGNLRFTKNFDVVNHVISEYNIEEIDSVEISIETLDNLFITKFPTLLKIDVEGFEINVLRGGHNVLLSSELKAIIIELNNSGYRYGVKDQQIHDVLLSYKFYPYSYKPFIRKLERIPIFLGYGNTIYIKDKDFVEARVNNSRKYSVLGKTF
jgi:FkbM family methyltransferase